MASRFWERGINKMMNESKSAASLNRHFSAFNHTKISTGLEHLIYMLMIKQTKTATLFAHDPTEIHFDRLWLQIERLYIRSLTLSSVRLLIKKIHFNYPSSINHTTVVKVFAFFITLFFNSSKRFWVISIASIDYYISNHKV